MNKTYKQLGILSLLLAITLSTGLPTCSLASSTPAAQTVTQKATQKERSTESILERGKAIADARDLYAAVTDDPTKFDTAKGALLKLLAETTKDTGMESDLIQLADDMSYESKRNIRWDEAAEIKKAQLGAGEAVHGQNSPMVDHICRDIAETYGMAGNYKEEENYLQKIVTIREQFKGIDRALLADALGELAGFQLYLKENDAAQSSLERQLQVLSSGIPGTSFGEKVKCYDNLGQVYTAQGKTDKAIEAYTNALTIACDAKNGLGEPAGVEARDLRSKIADLTAPTQK